uniref:polysaccharide biosynthesis protein n=1 Tax=uncultured Psychrobacter sp. TaxID=259303 RepID=UPI0032B19A29
MSIPSKRSNGTQKDVTRLTQRSAEYLLNLPRSFKRIILMLADFMISMVCLFFAIAARYGYIDRHISMPALAFYALLPVIGLYIIGFYKGVARSFFDAMMGNVLQLFLVLIVIAQAVLYFGLLPGMPRAVPIIYLFLFFIWLWNSRLTIRELLARWQGQRPQRQLNDDSDNVLIYGAGEAGKELLEGLRNSHKYNVVAFVDDDAQLTGAYVLGKRIYGADELVKVVSKLDISQVFLAIPSISRASKRQIIDKLEGISIKIKELPSLEEIAEEKVTVSSMRRVDILDVLDRQTVEPVESLLQLNIKNKCVLVTGAGGSIGSELCRQIIKNKPKYLVLYELSEFALYSIHQELIAKVASKENYKGIEVIAVIGNVTNEGNLLRVLKRYQIQ